MFHIFSVSYFEIYWPLKQKVYLFWRKYLLQKMDFHFLPTVLQVGVLNVVEAPDILYNETSNDTIVAEGASVSLR